MTKRDFREYSKSLGYDSYKELLEKLGYSKRYLDRCKLDEKIPQRLSDKIKGESNKEDVKQEEPKELEHNTNSVGECISNREYHNSDKLGSSKIKMILENAKEYYTRYVSKEVETKKTDAMIIGSLHHTLVLEPQKLDEEYIIIDMPSRPKKEDYVSAIKEISGEVYFGDKDGAKAKLEELKNCEKQIVTKSQYEQALATAEKALNSYFVVEVGKDEIFKAKLKDMVKLDRCYVERTFYGEIDGVEIQVRPDLLINLGKESDVWFCVDLKTSKNSTERMFAKQSSEYYYDLQQYLYVEILKQNGINVVDFRFCVAGKDEESESNYYKLHNEDIEDAEQIVKAVLKKYKYCKENNDWREGKFDYVNMRFEPVCTVKLPTYRKFKMIDMGLL